MIFADMVLSQVPQHSIPMWHWDGQHCVERWKATPENQTRTSSEIKLQGISLSTKLLFSLSGAYW